MTTNLRKLYYSFFFLTIFSCNGEKKVTPEFEKDFSYVDSLIMKNSINNDSITKAVQNSDSNITKKIETTVKQINKLENEVKVLKKENNELKNVIDKSDDVGKPFKLIPISDGKNDR